MSSPQKGITKVEILVILIVSFIFIYLATPTIGYGFTKGPMMQTLSNMRQIQIATQAITVDNETLGVPIRWTCSNSIPLTYTQWTNSLTNANLSGEDIKKLLSVKEERTLWWDNITENAITVFAVTASDPSDTLLLATKNWHGTKATNLSGAPYYTKGVVLLHKGGDGCTLKQSQLQNTNLIGSGGEHHYLPLK